MEKRIWSKPEMHEFAFAANEYVAACGDENKKYLFECNAGSEWNYYNVFMNGEDGIAGTEDDYAWAAADQYNPVGKGPDGNILTGYHPCGKKHEAPTNDIFHKGYMYLQGLISGNNYEDRIDVIIWTENDTNVHCTSILDQKSWLTAKS